jgi:lactoylglutathione lyase
MEIPKIGYVNLFVTKLDASIVFYRDVLGLRVEMEDGDFGYASFDAGPIRLGLAQIDASGSQGALIGRHTGIGLCVADLTELARELEARGVEFIEKPTRQPWGGFMALIADPDGNVLYLDQAQAH